jgi:hypothetical protein
MIVGTHTLPSSIVPDPHIAVPVVTSAG